jgi:hypothetical protein
MKKSFLTAIVAIFALGTTSVYGQFVYDANGNATIDRVGTTSTTSVTIKNSTSGLNKSSILKIGDFKISHDWIGTSCGTNSLTISNSVYPTLYPTISMFSGRVGFSFNTNVLCNTSILTSPAKYVFDTLTAINRLYIGDVTQTFPTLNPKYKLYVGGSMVCEELVVKLRASWADYVFAPDYTLMKLSDVKTYIAANSHLPGVPAACEIAENGVATGEMLAIQMKKIEELTLYLIQMEERIKQLEAQNQALQNTIGQ